jgi:DNA repair protein RecN (Recombination protein N)
MLGELHIKNFAVIKDITMTFGHGLNVISGDEGTGKSLIVDALSFLMGARASAGLIRNGSNSARIEAIFWTNDITNSKVRKILDESGIEPEANGMFLISRDFQDGGKSVARVNNRAVPLSTLRQVSKNLIDIHGQMEYLSLLDSSNQLNLLDSYGDLNKIRFDLGKIVEKFRYIKRQLESSHNGDNEGHIELLQYQIEEINRARLGELDEEQLNHDRDILRRAEAICGGCLDAYNCLYGDERSASVAIHKTLTNLRGISAIDNNLAVYRDKLESDLANMEEMARELKDYSEKIENSQEKLTEIEFRLEELSKLKRKYGNSIETILAFRDGSLKELNDIQDGQEKKALLAVELNHLKEEAGKKAEVLSIKRRQASEQLIRLVNEELVELGLEWAKFDINLSRKEDTEGLMISGSKTYAFTSDGIDRVEFQVSTNPGEPMKSMAAVASGGETSRIILAIKSALKIADPIPTLVFDEIDMGVGGRGADSVGKKLATLSTFHQVLCITHLPQIACFADSHYKMIKELDNGKASTKVQQVDGQNRLKEIAVMLGSERNSNLMLKGAESLIKDAEKWKSGARELVSA